MKAHPQSRTVDLLVLHFGAAVRRKALKDAREILSMLRSIVRGEKPQVQSGAASPAGSEDAVAYHGMLLFYFASHRYY